MLTDPVRLELEVARAAVESGKTVRSSFRVRGWSMLPAVEPGMRVTIESAEPESLRPGELVCWCRGGKFNRDGPGLRSRGCFGGVGQDGQDVCRGPSRESCASLLDSGRGPLGAASAGMHKVVHRLVRTMKDDEGKLVLITRGDASGVDDRPVPAERVMGRVLRVEKARMRFRLRRLAARMKAVSLRAAGRLLRCAR